MNLLGVFILIKRLALQIVKSNSIYKKISLRISLFRLSINPRLFYQKDRMRYNLIGILHYHAILFINFLLIINKLEMQLLIFQLIIWTKILSMDYILVQMIILTVIIHSQTIIIAAKKHHLDGWQTLTRILLIVLTQLSMFP